MAETAGHFEASGSTARALPRDGRPVGLSPTGSAVLHCLLEGAGRLVSKNELLDRVSPDVAVSDASLKVRIDEFRALGDAVAAERFIAAVHRSAGVRPRGLAESPLPDMVCT